MRFQKPKERKADWDWETIGDSSVCRSKLRRKLSKNFGGGWKRKKRLRVIVYSSNASPSSSTMREIYCEENRWKLGEVVWNFKFWDNVDNKTRKKNSAMDHWKGWKTVQEEKIIQITENVSQQAKDNRMCALKRGFFDRVRKKSCVKIDMKCKSVLTDWLTNFVVNVYLVLT